MAKELQGFGAPALLLDTLQLAASLRPRVHGISASVDGMAVFVLLPGLLDCAAAVLCGNPA